MISELDYKEQLKRQSRIIQLINLKNKTESEASNLGNFYTVKNRGKWYVHKFNSKQLGDTWLARFPTKQEAIEFICILKSDNNFA